MTSLATFAVTAGFIGKIPARGDFVRSGLPRDFTGAWDEWWQTVLLGSRDLLGTSWPQAWLQAPVWRFALPAGICGGGAVLGLWMPSVDSAGRYYPLTIAAVCACARDWTALARVGAGFLAEAERAGLAALEDDITPDALTTRIGAALVAAPLVFDVSALDGNRIAWWTEGSTLVSPQAFAAATLPDAAQFAAMIAGPPEGSPS